MTKQARRNRLYVTGFVCINCGATIHSTPEHCADCGRSRKGLSLPTPKGGWRAEGDRAQIRLRQAHAAWMELIDASP